MLFENVVLDRLVVKTLKSPFGDFSYVAADNLVKTADSNVLRPLVLALGFTADQKQIVDLLSLQEQKIPLKYDASHAVLDEMFSQYCSGNHNVLNQILVSQPETPFTSAVRKAMRTIPVGNTFSYKKLAETAGNGKASRAAGTACAKNRLALVVPCHRVVRSDGNLGGYAWGLTVKEKLLQHEQTS